MRKIDYIFVHCTASPQNWGVEELRREFKNKGWKNPGYHLVVTKDGGLHQMLSFEAVSNGVRGYNHNSINIAYVGGIDKNGRGVDNRTEEQKSTLLTTLKTLHKKFPNAKIMGHRDIFGDDPKTWKKLCPCFNAKEEYGKI